MDTRASALIPPQYPASVHRTSASLVAALLLLAGCGDGGGTEPEAGQDRAGGTVESPTEVLGDADEGIEGVQAVRVHYPVGPHRTEDIDYGLRPPAGGLHDGVWWNCGFYDEPVRDENVGHALEHGVVWLSFSPGLDEGDVDVVHELVRRFERVLAAPYEGLEDGVAVVATAWARRLTLDRVDDPRLADFVEQYLDGDQAPEAGASCEGGIGDPIP